FTYSYLSGGYTHLAEYKAEMNQFTDYVVSGNFSLKSNEFGLVGEALRTRPNQSKLEANTQYELTCRYETGVNGAYALTVKRPNGTVVCSAPLDAVPLRGEGAAVKVSFATGDYDDAYLALEYKADITKLPYASAGEKPEGSGMEYYYLSLDDVAIKKAETGAGEKIVSLGAMRTNTYKGVAPVLMGRVAATYEGGRKGYVDVVWAEIDPATLAAAGTLTVKGTVQGTALPAEYTVTVMETESMASTADLRALVTYAKAQQKAPAYAIVIPAVKTAFEQALTAAEAGCGEAAPDTQPSGSYYTLLARTHLLGYVGDKAQLDALYLASKDLTRGDTAEADWVAFTKALARAKTALTAENILQAEYDLLHQQLTAAVAALKETPPYIPPENPSRDPNKKTETVKNEDGSTTKTVTDKKTGDAVATTKYPDGTKVVTNIPKTGEPTAKVTVPAGKEHVTVTVPIKNATPGMVAIIVHADGTEEIVKCSATTKDGMKVQLKEGATLKFKDNSKQFDDVKTDAWHADAVAFASSRELFNGVSAKEFAPELPMTRSMLVTVLCRLSGDTVTQGETWFAGSMDWAKEQKISDGTNPEAKISRESLAVMLYRYAKADKVAADLTAFSDAEGVSDWAQDAMNWAVKIGLINGKDGKLAPADDASRAEVATMLQRFVEVVELAG
ncbi:MAG: S-layer homology domain-containing protein, partial [Oscillospiraceae bacterium]